MRAFFVVAPFMATCHAAFQCGKGPVDLSRLTPFKVGINCPANKDESGVEMGCVTARTKGQGGADQTQKSNTFYVNPCQSYTPIPDATCAGIDENGAAYEVTEDIGKDGKTSAVCYSLGTKATKATFDFYDKDNPDEGLRATYTGGSSCGGARKRTIEVNYHCSDRGNAMNNDVAEPSTCSYVIHRNTVQACPAYCVTGNQICNGNGVCGHHAEPCLCDDGFTGRLCEKTGYPTGIKAPESFTIASALLGVTLVILGGLLAFLLYMWIKLRRLAPVDTEAYSTLTSKFNELGQIT